MVIRIKILMILSFWVTSTMLYSQSGKLEGTITDKATSETLTGATIQILETGEEVLTDFDGAFSFNSLNTGNYTLKITYISYKTQKISQIQVSTNDVTHIAIPLEKAEANISSEIEALADKQKMNASTGREGV